jgi:ubiquinone/menaquinone biosynthesis C-methylase UbiE
MSESVRHPIFARLYARAAVSLEKAGAGPHRDELLAGIAGKVIEIGAGTGLNFCHYPPTVTEVVAIEPESHLREIAIRTAGSAPVHVSVVDGVADALPWRDGEFDAGVVSLVLCTVADPSAALKELRRVIRSGGELRFYEHVRSDSPKRARMQDLANRIWPSLAGGCQTNRRTLESIAKAGFELGNYRQFTFQPFILNAPICPMIIGRATVG